MLFTITEVYPQFDGLIVSTRCHHPGSYVQVLDLQYA